MPHGLLGLGEIDHRAGLHAGGDGVADAEHFDGMAAPAQDILRRAAA